MSSRCVTMLHDASRCVTMRHDASQRRNVVFLPIVHSYNIFSPCFKLKPRVPLGHHTHSNKGSSINDVTQFWKCSDPPSSPLSSSVLLEKGLSTVVTKSFTPSLPKTVASFMDDPKTVFYLPNSVIAKAHTN